MTIFYTDNSAALEHVGSELYYAESGTETATAWKRYRWTSSDADAAFAGRVEPNKLASTLDLVAAFHRNAMNGNAGSWVYLYPQSTQVNEGHSLGTVRHPVDPALVYTASANRQDGWAIRVASTNPVHSSQVQESVAAQLLQLDARRDGNEEGTSILDLAPLSAGYYGTVSPNAALLETLPERARPFATRTIMTHNAYSGVLIAYGDTQRYERNQASGEYTNMGEALVADARLRYREWLRSELGRNRENGDAEFERKRQEHRAKTAQNFEAFRNKATVQHQVIPTLPFLPHGLASSRRWGIEIESGGARGVKAPSKKWTRKGDGSLRSAWAGYQEVQDFEPFDEVVTEQVAWHACASSERHMPHEEYYDPERGEYMYRIRTDYIPAEECADCGEVTRTVRREPQTITHSAQSEDCAEFVSPILVSMHSNGLEKLLSQLKLQPQNDTAGVHVHVESNDLTPVQINTLIYGYDLLEPLIESSYQRNRRNYCERSPQDDVLRAARSAKARSTARDYENRRRYSTVNTQALNAHGTIEFRAMGPVYEYEHLIRWAMFCREMVNVVAAGATQKDFGRIKKWDDLLVLFAKYGKEFVRASVYEMTGETGTQAKLAKAGKAITTEAANADFEALVASIAAGDGQFTMLARAIARLGRSASEFAVSDELLETV